MNARRAALWVGVLATLAYVNAVPNGFAYDDTTILARNAIVTEGRVMDAWTHPYWPRHSEASGLYRPVTIASFAAEWRVFGPNPVGYHAVNVAAHAGVTLLLFALLIGWTGVGGAALGASIFAVHPLHTEAVANIVGRGELYAAAAALAALWLYDRGRGWSGLRRVGRLLGVAALYFLGLGSKEIAVTLPGLMLLTDGLHAYRSRDRSGEPGAASGLSLVAATFRAAWRDAPVYLICVAALGGYLVARTTVVGALLGELPAPSLRGLSSAERLTTALSLWPHYLRLLVFPLTLSADYSPAVLFPIRSLASAEALTGLLALAVTGAIPFVAWRRAPLVAVGVAWFAVAISPISQVLFPTGVLLAERTLYLPSVAVALVAAGLWELWASRPEPTPSRVRAVRVAVVAVVALLLVRTVARNPSWMSTYTALDTLAREHPESSLAVRTRATGLVRAGDLSRGAELYETAIELEPNNYSILTEVGHHYGERGAWSDGERVLRRAIDVAPDRAAAYRLLASQMIVRERYREAHSTALHGLAVAGADRELFSIVSETYVAKGDFAAAVRARYGALGQDPASVHDWVRLAEILALAGDESGARGAWTRAREVHQADPGQIEFTPTGRIVYRPLPVPGQAAQ